MTAVAINVLGYALRDVRAISVETQRGHVRCGSRLTLERVSPVSVEAESGRVDGGRSWSGRSDVGSVAVEVQAHRVNCAESGRCEQVGPVSVEDKRRRIGRDRRGHVVRIADGHNAHSAADERYYERQSRDADRSWVEPVSSDHDGLHGDVLSVAGDCWLR
ncbi:MAG TPA: hypothetical protein VEX37_13830 [Thermomicrobiales bacterium]|nr:hypothetical protein [Thermomicrobiales bacterium]